MNAKRFGVGMNYTGTGWEFCPWCGRGLMPVETLNLSVPGDYILYGSQLLEFLETIRNGMMQGFMHVTLDWNRSGWRTDTPLDGVIYRITVGDPDPLLHSHPQENP